MHHLAHSIWYTKTVAILWLLTYALQLSVQAEENGTPSTTSWEYAACQIGINCVSSDQSVDVKDVQAIEQQLRTLIERERIGAWSITSVSTAATDGDSPVTTAGTMDKQIAIDLKQLSNTIQARIQVTDLHTTQVLPDSTISTTESTKLAALILAELDRLVLPVARVSKWDGTQVTLRVRGGQLRTILKNYTPGTVLLPVERVRGLTNLPTTEQVRPIAWTWLIVEKLDAGKVIAKAHSALPSNGDPGDNTGSEVLALPITAVNTETVLAIQSTNNKKTPLAGLNMIARLPSENAKIALTTMTDPTGTVALKPRMDHTRQTPRIELWNIEIYLGDEFVTSLPLVPGALKSEKIALPLEPAFVEAWLQLQLRRAKLTDTISRRQVLQARILDAAKAKQTTVVSQLRGELTALPTAAQLLTGLPVIDPAKYSEAGTGIETWARRTRKALSNYHTVTAKLLGGAVPADGNKEIDPSTEPMNPETPPESM
jgi:hypothetical protein